jgi:hypothetical protein
MVEARKAPLPVEVRQQQSLAETPVPRSRGHAVFTSTTHQLHTPHAEPTIPNVFCELQGYPAPCCCCLNTIVLELHIVDLVDK